jgi:hypothetical protein
LIEFGLLVLEDSIWPACSGEEDLKKNSVHFYSFAIISPWRRDIPFV